MVPYVRRQIFHKPSNHSFTMKSTPVIHTLQFIGSFPNNPPLSSFPEYAFVGRSNVGKSSAINALLGRKKAARVSRTPGRTQMINIFEINSTFRLVDLPGYGFAKVPAHVRKAWKNMMNDYLFQREALRRVVVLVDARHSAQRLDLEMIATLQQTGTDFVVAATKVDALKSSKRVKQLRLLRQGLGVSKLIPFSSISKEGVVEIWQQLGSGGEDG